MTKIYLCLELENQWKLFDFIFICLKYKIFVFFNIKMFLDLCEKKRQKVFLNRSLVNLYFDNNKIKMKVNDLSSLCLCDETIKIMSN